MGNKGRGGAGHSLRQRWTTVVDGALPLRAAVSPVAEEVAAQLRLLLSPLRCGAPLVANCSDCSARRKKDRAHCSGRGGSVSVGSGQRVVIVGRMI